MTSALVTVTVPPQLSLVGRIPGFAGGTLLAQDTVTLPGQVTVGGVISNTVITWAHVAVLLHASVAVYVLVTVKRLAQVILVMTSALVTVTRPPQLSPVGMLPGTAGGTLPAHDTVTFAGHVNVGGVLSNTVIVCTHVAEFPQRSVA